MKKNVILTIFAASSQAPCSKWAKEFFEDEPIVLVVPGGGGTAFRNHIIRWAKTGDLFRAALKELAPAFANVEIGKRGLVTFSAGWAGADELLKFEAERNRLDAYLLLDGCHTRGLDHWSKFATRAANMEAFMVMAHTDIRPPTLVSAKDSNSIIFDAACKANDLDTSKPILETEIPNYVSSPTLPSEGIKIYLGPAGSLPAVTKHWKKDSLINAQNRGDLTKLYYSGNDRPDHCYVAWYVSKRLWKWLGQVWNDEVIGI